MNKARIKLIQQVFQKAGLYSSGIDGIIGRGTASAVAAAKAPAVKGSELVAAAQKVMSDAKINVGDIDGYWGPATESALEQYLDLPNWRDEESEKTESAGDWPVYKDLRRFYGKPGTDHAKMTLPYPMRIAWNTKQTVTRVTLHKKIKAASEAIFEGALEHYGMDGIRELGLDLFGGVFNNRKMRGGSRLSTHAFACAWDLDPIRNQLRWRAPKARLSHADAVPFWKLVEAQGGLSLGRKKGYDWMHFQFCVQ